MRAFRFARLYLSALEATGLVVITASDSPAGLAPNHSQQGTQRYTGFAAFVLLDRSLAAPQLHCGEKE